MNETKLRSIAIYLPQFHPIHENDAWWGKGFTEWNNVVKAKPLYKGHYQPHLPADLGFYDLRLSEVREAQANMAMEHGIYGFCYYHYWFSGKRILGRPFQEVFETGKPDFPFMLCWANENWTRTWDGLENNILLEQLYSEEDDRAHIQSLIPYFKDNRYIKVNNKPVFAIYKSGLLPSPERTIQIWREEALKQGIELYLCRFESFGKQGKTYMNDGFDAGIDFQPFSQTLEDFRCQERLKHEKDNSTFKRRKKLYQLTNQKDKTDKLNTEIFELVKNNIDYNAYVEHILKSYKFPEDYVMFPGITPSWDNTARRGEKGFMLHHANPAKFKEWLGWLKENYKPHSEDENFIFINAWNEWAEGNHLEPCQKWGLQYLQAVKEVFYK